MHQTAHRQTRHVHEETQVAHINHQRGIRRRIGRLQLRLQERVHLHILAVALGIGGIAFRVGDMFRRLLERMRRAVAFLKQRAMHHQVGVTADRRGEVRVFFLGQPVMPERLHVVTRAHQRTQKPDLQRRADGNAVELLQQLGNFRALAQVAAWHLMTQHVLAIFVQAAFIRLLVDAVDRLLIFTHQARGHGFVGEQHVFLNQLMRHVVLHFFQAQNAALFVETDFRFGKIQRERTGLETSPPDILRQLMRVVEHLLNGIFWRCLQEREHFLIAEPPLRMDHRWITFRLQHLAVIRHEKLHALGQAVHVGLERAQFIAQRLGQHRNHAVHQISRVAAFARLDVQRGAGLHVMRHVGDVNPELPLLRRNPAQTNRVVEILRVVGINRHHRVRPAIFPTRQILRQNRRANRARFRQNLLGKMQRQVVLPQHRQHVHAFLVGRAEHLDDFTFGIGVSRFPLAQFHHHLVADERRPAHVTRGRHVNVMRHPGIVGHDVEKFAALLQRADDLRPLPFENANDRTRFLTRTISAQTARPAFATHEHAIPVERGRGRFLRNHDLLQLPVVRLQKAFALAVDLDAARHQVRVAG